MQAKSCFFIGHRDVSCDIFTPLLHTVERLIVKHGVTEFFVGHYGDFDRLAAKAVIAAKKAHPEICLSMLLPYHPTEQPMQLPAGFDLTYYPEALSGVPRKLAIVRANRYMIDHVDHLIAFAWHPASNARDLVEYARRRETRGGIVVCNLAEECCFAPFSP